MSQPASVLFSKLADARRAGESFEQAWPVALTAALASVPNNTERREWMQVLGGMVQTWLAAFERQPASTNERALSLLADNTDRVPVPDRECEHCHGEVGTDRGPLARYCSDDCKREANRESGRIARAA